MREAPPAQQQQQKVPLAREIHKISHGQHAHVCPALFLYIWPFKIESIIFIFVICILIKYKKKIYPPTAEFTREPTTIFHPRARKKLKGIKKMKSASLRKLASFRSRLLLYTRSRPPLWKIHSHAHWWKEILNLRRRNFFSCNLFYFLVKKKRKNFIRSALLIIYLAAKREIRLARWRVSRARAVFFSLSLVDDVVSYPRPFLSISRQAL